MGAGGILNFLIEGVALALLGLFGIGGNLLSIVCLSSTEMDMKPSFRHLLKMLAAFDATFLVFTITLFGISPWSEDYDQFVKPYLIPYFLPIIQVSSEIKFYFHLRRKAKVNNKYQGPKDVAPFHLLLLFENSNGFK